MLIMGYFWEGNYKTNKSFINDIQNHYVFKEDKF